MAKAGEEEVEYESDPEEEKKLLGMRRRKAASDDEEEEEERIDRRAVLQSDESDGQGGAADYEEDELEEDYEEVYEEEAYQEEYVERAQEREEERKGEGQQNGEEAEEVAEKKENEPSAVPSAGAFYMHDDRFRDNAAARHRKTYGARKLWESKDDKKWVHDKFEEMGIPERHHDQGRRGSGGNYRGGGGKNRGPDHGYARRNRSKTFSNGYNQSPAPKGVRGRGPRKYEPVYKNGSQTSQPQNKQPGKHPEKSSFGNSGRVPSPASNTESNQAQLTKKYSSLNSASPPFYPSGSSNKDIPLTQKKGVQAGRTVHTPFVDETFSGQQGNTSSKGKNVAESVGIDKPYIDDAVDAASGKLLNNIQASHLAPTSVNAMQSTQSRVQGRDVTVSGQMTYQASGSRNVSNRISHSTHLHTTQRNSSQGRGQTSNQAPGQQVGLRSGSGSQASSPPKSSVSVNSNDLGEAETNTELSKSRNALVGKGKTGNQGSGRGSFLYGGAQVMGAAGNMVAGRGDQNFPAFLPVMQFGGQNPGGIGVPAVGMAFPGYVAQPQLGLGNSEMTWLPVLAGAAGALGATYCSPYLSVDGSYQARPPGQTPSLGSLSKENSTDKTNNDWKPSQKPEVANDEFGQRQKPRRYSEMDFKQPSTSS